MRQKLRKLFDWFYLLLSDCDGMCSHCPEVLRVKCERRKGSVLIGEHRHIAFKGGSVTWHGKEEPSAEMIAAFEELAELLQDERTLEEIQRDNAINKPSK